MDKNKMDNFDLEIQALKQKAMHIDDMLESSGKPGVAFFDQNEHMQRRKSHRPKMSQEKMISERDIDKLFDKSVKISRGEWIDEETHEELCSIDNEETIEEENVVLFEDQKNQDEKTEKTELFMDSPEIVINDQIDEEVFDEIVDYSEVEEDVLVPIIGGDSVIFDEVLIEESEDFEQNKYPEELKILEKMDETPEFEEIVIEEKPKKQRPVIHLEPVKVNWGKWSAAGGFVDVDAEEKAAKEAARIAEEEAIRKAEEERIAAEKEAEEKLAAEKAAKEREALKVTESPAMEILRSYHKEKDESLKKKDDIQPEHQVEKEDFGEEEINLSCETFETELIEENSETSSETFNEDDKNVHFEELKDHFNDAQLFEESDSPFLIDNMDIPAEVSFPEPEVLTETETLALISDIEKFESPEFFFEEISQTEEKKELIEEEIVFDMPEEEFSSNEEVDNSEEAEELILEIPEEEISFEEELVDFEEEAEELIIEIPEEEISFEEEIVDAEEEIEELILEIPEEKISFEEELVISEEIIEENNKDDNINNLQDEEIREVNSRKPIFAGMTFAKGNEKKDEIFHDHENQIENLSDHIDERNVFSIEEIVMEEEEIETEETDSLTGLSFLDEHPGLFDDLEPIDLSSVETESVISKEEILSEPFEERILEEEGKVQEPSEPVLDYFGEPSNNMSVRLAAMDEFFKLSKREEEIPSVLDDLSTRISNSDMIDEVKTEKEIEKDEEREEKVFVSDTLMDLDIIFEEDIITESKKEEKVESISEDVFSSIKKDEEIFDTEELTQEELIEEELPEIESQYEDFDKDKKIEEEILSEEVFFEEDELIEEITEEKDCIQEKDDIQTFATISFDPDILIFEEITEDENDLKIIDNEMKFEEECIQEEEDTSTSDFFEEELSEDMISSEIIFTEEMISDEIIMTEPFFEEETFSEKMIESEPVFKEKIVPDNLIGSDPIFEEEIL